MAADGVVPVVVIDPAGEPVAPVSQFLRDFVAQGNRPGCVRSYAYDLLRWWRCCRSYLADLDCQVTPSLRVSVIVRRGLS